MATWPTSLPTYPDDGGFTETPPNLALVTPQDIGPPKLRRRMTSGAKQIKARYTLTDSQVTTFRSFFLGSLTGGIAFFDWPHPRLASSVSARLIDIPSIVSEGYDRYSLTLSLEVS